MLYYAQKTRYVNVLSVKCEKFYNKRITIFSNYLCSWRTEKLGK